MNFSPEAIASFAPDAAAVKAAQALAKPDKWHNLAADDESVRGDHQGSAPEAYRTRVAFDGPSFRCSCPSRKIPCKHALALMLLHAVQPEVFIDPSPSGPGSLFGSAPVETDDTLQLPPSWATVLEGETQKPYFSQLSEFLREERASETIYPPDGEEFGALEATPYEAVKVLILGQDPYHGPRQAHGMAFSVRVGVPPPPSLQNIFQELRDDVGAAKPKDGFLMPWAQQGVLLLNAVLTVRRGEPNSHKGRGWEKFTDAIIKQVSNKPTRVVFVLWGAYAQKKSKLIDTSRHVIVQSVHPSPLSAHNGFFGSQPFSQINAALRDAGQEEVDWQLPERSAT